MTTAQSRTVVPVLPVRRLADSAPAAVVDLRSPSEFAEDHVPGACNVPLFDDVERAVIGTLYVRRSAQDAFEAGRVRTRTKIRALVERVAALAGWSPETDELEERVDRMTSAGIAALEEGLVSEPVGELPPGGVILYCWRGGLRSKSVVAFLRGLGLAAVGMEGGYKGYRRHVRERLQGWSAPPSFVIRGLTGVGKTLVLRELERIRPGWTVDLEAAAGHRSSILGMVGLRPCSQKAFESRLAARLAAGFPGPCVFEGESRKVGDAILPASVWAALDGGTSLRLTAGVERRVEVLASDYLAREENRAELAERLPFLEERLGPRHRGELVVLLEARRDAELVELLLERYYDPLYRHSEQGRTYAATFDAAEPARAAREIAAWIEAQAS